MRSGPLPIRITGRIGITRQGSDIAQAIYLPDTMVAGIGDVHVQAPVHTNTLAAVPVLSVEIELGAGRVAIRISRSSIARQGAHDPGESVIEDTLADAAVLTDLYDHIA